MEVFGDMQINMEEVDADVAAETRTADKMLPAVLELEDYAEDGSSRGNDQSSRAPRPAHERPRFTSATRPRKACPSPFQAGASRILEVGAHAKEREALLFRKLEMHVERSIEEEGGEEEEEDRDEQGDEAPAGARR